MPFFPIDFDPMFHVPVSSTINYDFPKYNVVYAWFDTLFTIGEGNPRRN